MIIHLVGTQRSNDQPGRETHLIAAIKALGHTLISTDLQKDGSRLPALLAQEADLILVCHGEGIEAHLIESCPCVTALWHMEPVGPWATSDEGTLARRNKLALNIRAFDYVFGNQENIDVYKRLGAENVAALPNPTLSRQLDLPQKYEVTLSGDEYGHCIHTIIQAIDFSMNRRIWPAYIIGVPTNRQGQPTRRMDRFNARVNDLLKTSGYHDPIESQ
ncbi:MAG: hypothetical protein CSYNP_01507 [Syntrophus sp. SKADARSKE-3]|nr:hypothetical protein [Syntrophus sp. SKADARSKE-3]